MTGTDAAREALEAAQQIRTLEKQLVQWRERYERARLVLERHLDLASDPLAPQPPVEPEPEPPVAAIVPFPTIEEPEYANGASHNG